MRQSILFLLLTLLTTISCRSIKPGVYSTEDDEISTIDEHGRYGELTLRQNGTFGYGIPEEQSYHYGYRIHTGTWTSKGRILELNFYDKDFKHSKSSDYIIIERLKENFIRVKSKITTGNLWNRMVQISTDGYRKELMGNNQNSKYTQTSTTIISDDDLFFIELRNNAVCIQADELRLQSDTIVLAPNKGVIYTNQTAKQIFKLKGKFLERQNNMKSCF